MSESRFYLRFKQFEKAFLLLSEAVKIEFPSVIERAGIIKAFEMAFELSWKMLKDYEEKEGFDIRSPRAALKQAFQSDLLGDGHDWLDALEDRNITTHTYNEETATDVELRIREIYYPQILDLYEKFKKIAVTG